MTMIAAVLVHPAWTIAVGIVALLALWWYWAALADERVPLSRRRLRRITTMLLLVAIPILVAALSFIDRATHPHEFVFAWLIVLVLMLFIILGAALDGLNSLRLRARELDREIADAAKELKKAMDRQKREEEQGEEKSKGGDGGERRGRR